MLRISVLGPVRVTRDGDPLRVPTGLVTELLIRLALEAGTAVPHDRLVADLWPDDPAVARNTVQVKVSGLRRVLGDPGLVRADATGYTLLVDPTDVDALELLRLEAAGDVAAALAVLGDRVDLLPGDGAWLAPHRARLESARLALLEHRLRASVDDGGGAELVPALEVLTAAHPLREPFWLLLVTALYRAGRQADALAAVRRVRTVLARELGVEPGPALRELERLVLQQDPVLTGPVAGHLPRASGRLVGRAEDVAVVSHLLDRERLVTLVGPAGVGKSRLALEVARGSAGPAWLVRLEAARDGDGIWPALAAAFVDLEPGPDQVLRRLAPLSGTLVLDTCEHLGAALIEPVDRLLTAAPGLRVLVTSQVPLGLDGERVQPVEPLSLAAAVELFTDRSARAVGAPVEAICRRLDGLPLAVELAAARAATLPLAEIARRLDDRFELLHDPRDGRSTRATALSAAIAWSHDLLLPDDQRCLWALGCFASGAGYEGVRDVVAALGVPGPAVLDLLDRLADRSLLVVEAAADGSSRFRLLDSVRAFARERLTAAGLAAAADRAHAERQARLADAARDGVRGAAQPEHLAVARAERAEIDAASAWCAAHDPRLGLRIALGFAWSWAVLGWGVESGRRVRDAVVAAPDADPRERATGLLLAGWLEASGGDLDRAEADVRAAGEHPSSAVYLAFVRTQQARPADVLELLAAFRADRPPRDWEEGASWLLEAWARTAVGDLPAARAACDTASARLAPYQDAWATVHAQALLGGLAAAEGRFADAAAHHRTAAQDAGRLGFRAAQALHLCNLGPVELARGDSATAVVELTAAATVAGEIGELRLLAMARARLAQVLADQGRTEEARAAAVAALDWYSSAGGGDDQAATEALLARLDV